MINKAATISLVALLSIALVGVAVTHSVSAQSTTFLGDKGDKGKKPTAPKASVKVLVKVNNIPADTKELKAFLQVDGQKTIPKTVSMNGTQEDSAAIMFNKVNASKGDGFAVTVNDHIATGEIKDLKKPNKIEVKLS
jgi:hypothetical protein